MAPLSPERMKLERPRIQWTAQKRRALILLKRLYRNNISEIRKVWQTAFRDDLRLDGFFQTGPGEHGVSPSSLSMQQYEMARSKMEVYREVYENTHFDNLTRKFRKLNFRLVTAAKVAKVSLVPRECENNVIPPSRKNIRKFNAAFDYDNMNASDSSTEVGDLPDSDEQSETRQKSRQNAVPRRGTEISKARTLIASNPPPLLFRFYSTSSGGSNGSMGFKSGLQVSNESQLDIVHCASQHMNSAKNVEGKYIMTPFISTTSSFIFAVHKALKVSEELKPRIACLDASKIRNRVYSAIKLADEVRDRGLLQSSHYKGSYEWMVFGEITPEAVICDFAFKALSAFSDSNESVRQLLQLPLLEEKWGVQAARYALKPLTSSVIVNRAIGRIVGWMAPPRSFLEGHFYSEFKKVILQNWMCGPDAVLEVVARAEVTALENGVPLLTPSSSNRGTTRTQIDTRRSPHGIVSTMMDSPCEARVQRQGPRAKGEGAPQMMQ